jgi:hypothetical protein
VRQAAQPAGTMPTRERAGYSSPTSPADRRPGGDSHDGARSGFTARRCERDTAVFPNFYAEQASGITSRHLEAAAVDLKIALVSAMPEGRLLEAGSSEFSTNGSHPARLYTTTISRHHTCGGVWLIVHRFNIFEQLDELIIVLGDA